MQVSSYSLTNETRNLIEQSPVDKNVIQICRSSTTQLDISTQYVYLNNASVSSKHCKVSLNPETNVAEITDNSRNGTIILFQNKEYNIKNETMFCSTSKTSSNQQLGVKTRCSSFKLNQQLSPARTF
ncbi:Forkhead-associated_(FHA) domain [Hexamita inflata]|uniref:Forkhead-associated (FHA) domain n=1 Tax=Hexamita inflata TaxID=28002 RepID=A0AA86UEY9_9EUKA|nr:Forkhead-associated (FHA) domain [Hexamita inflata]